MSILFYYSKSANKPAGKGINEYLSPEDNFQELETIPDWRKILSNFYLANFEWEGNIYPSVEHEFQAKKISLVDSTKAKLFILGNSIGNEPPDIARKNRKLCILSKQLLDEWDLIKDIDITRKIFSNTNRKTCTISNQSSTTLAWDKRNSKT
jgi:hypothetical protein